MFSSGSKERSNFYAAFGDASFDAQVLGREKLYQNYPWAMPSKDLIAYWNADGDPRKDLRTEFAFLDNQLLGKKEEKKGIFTYKPVDTFRAECLASALSNFSPPELTAAANSHYKLSMPTGSDSDVALQSTRLCIILFFHDQLAQADHSDIAKLKNLAQALLNKNYSGAESFNNCLSAVANYESNSVADELDPIDLLKQYVTGNGFQKVVGQSVAISYNGDIDSSSHYASSLLAAANTPLRGKANSASADSPGEIIGRRALLNGLFGPYVEVTVADQLTVQEGATVLERIMSHYLKSRLFVNGQDGSGELKTGLDKAAIKKASLAIDLQKIMRIFPHAVTSPSDIQLVFNYVSFLATDKSLNSLHLSGGFQQQCKLIVSHLRVMQLRLNSGVPTTNEDDRNTDYMAFYIAAREEAGLEAITYLPYSSCKLDEKEKPALTEKRETAQREAVVQDPFLKYEDQLSLIGEQTPGNHLAVQALIANIKTAMQTADQCLNPASILLLLDFLDAYVNHFYKVAYDVARYQLEGEDFSSLEQPAVFYEVPSADALQKLLVLITKVSNFPKINTSIVDSELASPLLRSTLQDLADTVREAVALNVNARLDIWLNLKNLHVKLNKIFGYYMTIVAVAHKAGYLDKDLEILSKAQNGLRLSSSKVIDEILVQPYYVELDEQRKVFELTRKLIRFVADYVVKQVGPNLQSAGKLIEEKVKRGKASDQESEGKKPGLDPAVVIGLIQSESKAVVKMLECVESSFISWRQLTGDQAVEGNSAEDTLFRKIVQAALLELADCNKAFLDPSKAVLRTIVESYKPVGMLTGAARSVRDTLRDSIGSALSSNKKKKSTVPGLGLAKLAVNGDDDSDSGYDTGDDEGSAQSVTTLASAATSATTQTTSKKKSSGSKVKDRRDIAELVDLFDECVGVKNIADLKIAEVRTHLEAIMREYLVNECLDAAGRVKTGLDKLACYKARLAVDLQKIMKELAAKVVSPSVLQQVLDYVLALSTDIDLGAGLSGRKSKFQRYCLLVASHLQSMFLRLEGVSSGSADTDYMAFYLSARYRAGLADSSFLPSPLRLPRDYAAVVKAKAEASSSAQAPDEAYSQRNLLLKYNSRLALINQLASNNYTVIQSLIEITVKAMEASPSPENVLLLLDFLDCCIGHFYREAYSVARSRFDEVSFSQLVRPVAFYGLPSANDLRILSGFYRAANQDQGADLEVLASRPDSLSQNIIAAQVKIIIAAQVKIIMEDPFDKYANKLTLIQRQTAENHAVVNGLIEAVQEAMQSISPRLTPASILLLLDFLDACINHFYRVAYDVACSQTDGNYVAGWELPAVSSGETSADNLRKLSVLITELSSFRHIGRSIVDNQRAPASLLRSALQKLANIIHPEVAVGQGIVVGSGVVVVAKGANEQQDIWLNVKSLHAKLSASPGILDGYKTVCEVAKSAGYLESNLEVLSNAVANLRDCSLKVMKEILKPKLLSSEELEEKRQVFEATRELLGFMTAYVVKQVGPNLQMVDKLDSQTAGVIQLIQIDSKEFSKVLERVEGSLLDWRLLLGIPAKQAGLAAGGQVSLFQCAADNLVNCKNDFLFAEKAVLPSIVVRYVPLSMTASVINAISPASKDNKDGWLQVDVSTPGSQAGKYPGKYSYSSSNGNDGFSMGNDSYQTPIKGNS